MTITTLTPAGVRRAVQKLVFNPLAFGARGDGTTDDSLAFSRAIDAAHAADAVVEIGPGSYSLTTIHDYPMPASLKLIGAGAGFTILQSGMTWPVSSPDLTEDCFNIASTTTLEVSGITFSNFGITFRLPNTDSGVDYDLDKIKITKCEFYRCYAAFSTLRNFYNVTLDQFVAEDNHVHDCQTGVFIFAAVKSAQVHRNIVEDLERTHNSGTSMHQTCQAFSMLYTGNGEAEEFAIGDLHFTNNVIRRLHGAGTDTVSGRSDVNGIIASGVRLTATGNSISELTSVLGTNTEGLYFKGQDSLISNNTLTNAGAAQAAINIKKSTFARSNCTASGNVIRFTPAYNAALAALDTPGFSNGIRIEADDVTITGNRIEGTSGIGINQGAGEKKVMKITDNVIKPGGGIGIVVFDALDVLDLSGNNVVADGITSGSCTLVRLFNVASTGKKSTFHITNNNLQFLSTCTGMTESRCLVLIRNGDYRAVKFHGNTFLNDATAALKRHLNIVLHDTGDTDGDIELLEIFSNTFLPMDASNNEKLTCALTTMNGELHIANNRGFITEAQFEIEFDSSSTKDSLHGLANWSSLAGTTLAPPLSSFQLTPISVIGAASYVYTEATTQNSATFRLSANPGSIQVQVAVRAARNFELIPAAV